MGTWSFSLSATDANRWALRLSRAVTGRPRILVNSYCYHGSVDEALIVTGDGDGEPRPGNVGAPVDVALTSRVAEYNDLDGLARQLAHGDVAAVLMEPAPTNMGIVLPAPGCLDGVRQLTRDAGVLLIIDETHTISAGPGGCTQAWRLAPDILTLGKAIGGGIPAGAYGLSDEVVERVAATTDLDLVDTGGVGGTMAGNALSLAAVRATLVEVLTDAAFDEMTALATRYALGVQPSSRRTDCRGRSRNSGPAPSIASPRPAPRNGTESQGASDAALEDFLHVFLVNRGVLLTPFHNMALMCPATTAADVDVHVAAFEAAVRVLVDGAMTARRAIRVPAERRGMAGSSPAATRRDRGPRSRAG